MTGPTLTSRDHVYRVHLDGLVEAAWSGFGRPQGLTFGPDGLLYVVEALAGASGLYRLTPGRDAGARDRGRGVDRRGVRAGRNGDRDVERDRLAREARLGVAGLPRAFFIAL